MLYPIETEEPLQTNCIVQSQFLIYIYVNVDVDVDVKFDVENEVVIRNKDGFCIECENDEAGEAIGFIPNDDKFTGKFEGYTDKEATKKKILEDVFEKGDRWFSTGDLLKKNKQGYFYFVDRIGDTFRWKSEKCNWF